MAAFPRERSRRSSSSTPSRATPEGSPGGELPDEEVAEITEGNRIRATQMEGYVAGEEIRQSVREVEQDRRDRNAEHEARKAADEAVVETDALIAHPRRVLGIE